MDKFDIGDVCEVIEEHDDQIYYEGDFVIINEEKDGDDEYLCYACDSNGVREDDDDDSFYVSEEHIRSIGRNGNDEPALDFKYEVGDLVVGVRSGSGMNSKDFETQVRIVERGKYSGGRGQQAQPGYKVKPRIGNSRSGEYGGFIGENSFELLQKHAGGFEMDPDGMPYPPSPSRAAMESMGAYCKKDIDHLLDMKIAPRDTIRFAGDIKQRPTRPGSKRPPRKQTF